MFTKNNIIPTAYNIGTIKLCEECDNFHIKLISVEGGWVVRGGDLYLANTDFGIKDYVGKDPDFFYKNGTIFLTIHDFSDGEKPTKQQLGGYQPKSRKSPDTKNRPPLPSEVKPPCAE